MNYANSANNRIHSDSKKRRSSFLVALLFAAGDARRYAHNSQLPHTLHTPKDFQT
jgi:hypothetical protein